MAQTLTLALALALTMSLYLSLTLTHIEVGDGKTYPSYGDTLRVHYTGKLQECGTVFDSSRTPGRTPFDFKIGKKEVIPGWDEAIMKMSLGEVSLLMVPSSKAYGEPLSLHVRPGPSVLYVRATRTSLLRAARTEGAGRLALRRAACPGGSLLYARRARTSRGRAVRTAYQRDGDSREPRGLSHGRPRRSSRGLTHTTYPSPNAARTRTQAAANLRHGALGEAGAPDGGIPPFADLKFEVQLLEIRRQTSCLGAGRHGGVQKDAHEYSQLANQLLGRAPPPTEGEAVVGKYDDRQLMPVTSDMPAVATYQ